MILLFIAIWLVAGLGSFVVFRKASMLSSYYYLRQDNELYLEDFVCGLVFCILAPTSVIFIGLPSLAYLIYYYYIRNKD